MTAKPNSRIAISLLVLMVLLSSCSTAPSDDTEENGTTPKEENVTIAYLPSGMTSPFYSEAAQGQRRSEPGTG